MDTRYTQTLFASTATLATSGADVVTTDDNVNRTITGIFCNISTPLVRVQLQIQGKTVFDVDCSAFNNAAGFIPLDVSIKTPLLPHVNLVNGSAGTITNAAISLKFEVPDNANLG